MCRLLVVCADRPVSALPGLVLAPHALQRQSCGDLSGECHMSGWGIGYYADGEPVRVRSTKPAMQDHLYTETARAVLGTTIIGHIRQASSGGISQANTHPFVHDRWLFVHNGTVEGFAENPEPLRSLIPEHLRGCIEGETDSEHLFHALLGRLEHFNNLESDEVAGVLERLLVEVARLYPGSREEPTRLNIVMTDGRSLLATRWGYSLSLKSLYATETVDVTQMPDGPATVSGIAISSEPTSPFGWKEIPNRSVVVVREDRSYSVIEWNEKS
jgi:glutamine amidotransferase